MDLSFQLRKLRIVVGLALLVQARLALHLTLSIPVVFRLIWSRPGTT